MSAWSSATRMARAAWPDCRCRRSRRCSLTADVIFLVMFASVGAMRRRHSRLAIDRTAARDDAMPPATVTPRSPTVAAHRAYLVRFAQPQAARPDAGRGRGARRVRGRALPAAPRSPAAAALRSWLTARAEAQDRRLGAPARRPRVSLDARRRRGDSARGDSPSCPQPRPGRDRRAARAARADARRASRRLPRRACAT